MKLVKRVQGVSKYWQRDNWAVDDKNKRERRGKDEHLYILNGINP